MSDDVTISDTVQTIYLTRCIRTRAVLHLKCAARRLLMIRSNGAGTAYRSPGHSRMVL